MATKTLSLKTKRKDSWEDLASARKRRIENLVANGFLNHSRRNLAEAEKAYRRALQLDPKHLPALYRLGVLLLEKGQNEKALELADKALEFSPESKEIYFLQGNVHRATGNKDAAARAYLKVLDLEPKHVGAHLNLGSLLHESNLLHTAMTYYRKALEIDPRSIPALGNLGSVLKALGKRSEAAECYNKVLEIDPLNKQARHFLAALSGEEAETAPKDYVVGLFDHYASRFDEHLTKGLRYDAPREVREAVGRVLGVEKASLRVLDLGCGTGLCGPFFRALAGHLGGVDLSPKMLEQARKREVYDKLIEGDLTSALRKEKGTLDLAISADVLIYVGDLDEVFKACRRALREGGYFAFSTESFPGEGFLLRPSGRFAHSQSYIESLAQKYGFSVVLCDEVVLRIEDGRPMAGQVYVLCNGKTAARPAEAPKAGIDPQKIPQALHTAFLHHQAGHVEQAESLYRQILQLEPDNAEALHGLGVLARETGHHGAAVELISEAIRKNPSLASYHTNLGLAYYAQGKMEEAVGAMKKALELNPDAVDTHINLANLLKLQGKLEEAEGHYRKAVALFPSYAEAHNNLAVVLYEQGKMEEAENHYMQATDLAPEYADGMRNMAQFLRKQGRFPEAAKYFKRLVKLRPGDEEARRRLEECEAQLSPGAAAAV